MAKPFTGQVTFTGGDDKLTDLINDTSYDVNVAQVVVQATVGNAAAMTVGFGTAVDGISLDAKQWISFDDQGGGDSVPLNNLFVKGTAGQKATITCRSV